MKDNSTQWIIVRCRRHSGGLLARSAALLGLSVFSCGFIHHTVDVHVGPDGAGIVAVEMALDRGGYEMQRRMIETEGFGYDGQFEQDFGPIDSFCLGGEQLKEVVENQDEDWKFLKHERIDQDGLLGTRLLFAFRDIGALSFPNPVHGMASMFMPLGGDVEFEFDPTNRVLTIGPGLRLWDDPASHIPVWLLPGSAVPEPTEPPGDSEGDLRLRMFLQTCTNGIDSLIVHCHGQPLVNSPRNLVAPALLVPIAVIDQEQLARSEAYRRRLRHNVGMGRDVQTAWLSLLPEATVETNRTIHIRFLEGGLPERYVPEPEPVVDPLAGLRPLDLSPLRAGMTTDRVVSALGSPMRIDPTNAARNFKWEYDTLSTNRQLEVIRLYFDDGRLFGWTGQPDVRKQLSGAVSGGNLTNVINILDGLVEYVDLPLDSGMTALECTILYSEPAVAAELLKRGADPERPNHKGLPPLFRAIERGELDICGLLLDAGVDVNSMLDSGDTPLHKAVKFHKTTLLDFLVDRGADLSLRNRAGLTPLDIAIQGKRSIAHELRLYGAKTAEELDQGPLAPPPPPRPGTPPRDDAVVYYTFDDTNTALIADSAPGGHHGIGHNVEFVPGIIGNACRFGSRDSHIILPPGAISGLAEGTFAAWVRLERSFDHQFLNCVQRGDDISVQFRTDRECEPYIYLGNYNSETHMSAHAPKPLPLKQWCFVCYTWSPKGVRFYIDGQLVGESPPDARCFIPTNRVTFWIGRDTRLNYDPQTLRGEIDEAGVYQTALGDDDIASLYRLQLSQ